MAEGTYEYECERAELLGLEKPDQETFEKNLAVRMQQEKEEIEAAENAVSFTMMQMKSIMSLNV